MMRSQKKAAASVLVLMLTLIFVMSGCGGSKSDVLRVGIDDTYPPMEYKDDQGNYAGFDIELAQEIGKRLDKKVEFVSTAWSGIFMGLSSNKFDCIISSLSITEERKETIAFTRPYISNTQVIVTKSDNTTIKSAADFTDKIVGVQVGTTSDDACKEFQKATPFKDYKQYDAMTQALSELKIGRIDALVCDLVVGQYFVAKDKESYKLVEAGLPKEPIGVGFDKSNAKMAEEVDKVIEEISKDGTLEKISVKWFGEDMTKVSE